MMKKWIWAVIATMLLCFNSVAAQAEESNYEECTGYGVPMELVELQEYDAPLASGESDAGKLVSETVGTPNRYAAYSEAELTPDAVRNRMLALKSSYPEGMPWTNANFYAWKGGVYSGGYGCAGFAFILSDAAFGDMPARILDDMEYYNIRVGDILRVNNDTHSVIVLEVYDSYVVVAEGNYNSSIHWGRQISKASLESGTLTYIMTRYPTDAVTHNYQMIAKSGNVVTLWCADCGKQKTVTIPTTVKFWLDAGDYYYWSGAFESYGIPAEVNTYTSYLLEADDGDVASTIQLEIADASIATFANGTTKCMGESGAILGNKMGVTQLYIRSIYDNTILATYNLRVGEPLKGLNIRVPSLVAGKYMYEAEPQADSTVNIYNVSWNTSDYQFVCDKSYTLTFSMYPEAEYYFNNETIFTINDKAATIITLDEDYVELSYQFSPVAHNSQYHSKVAETCTEEGMKAYYMCTECGHLSWDAVGTSAVESLYDLFIPAAHKYSNAIDEDCDVCGETRVIPAEVENIFTDVQIGKWYVPYVQYIFDERIMIGKGVYTFGIGDNMSRAEFVQSLYNYEGQPAVTYEEYFTDVSSGKWYTNAVTWAYQNGISSGYTDGRFGINDKVQRQQIVQFLYNYAQANQMDMTTDPTAMDSYIDKDSASSWASDALNWAITQGVMSGKKLSDGTVVLDPKGYATREECAAMMKNLLEP